MKIYRLLIIIVFITLLNTGDGICKAPNRIPYKPDNFNFSMTHYVKGIKQKERFILTKKGKNKITKIHFSRVESNGKTKEFSHSIQGFWGKNEDLIMLLNYLDFMDIKQKKTGASHGNSPDIQSDTIFSLTYSIKGKKFSKTIRIQNIDQRIENPQNTNAFKLKYLLLFVEFSECSIYRNYSRDN